ncbi:MAG: transcription termination/antitermination protein NusA [Gracilimonas sp.]|uniref:Transcription termination/antitermination protein NusA n=1 Tax=Gracilimonas sediminicola TaxID=2952158 RepID=A0A9X2RFG0_9BACT|nr:MULTISPECIES: transcription termination factor NusA [Gracilimonas]MBO6586288.1 transcription termination/antitermination protein NusA [Gracilimonas sp.]MBO6614945.1 transcription termination/antitermination protein NusA [Gracilimonas sp.]MCP9292615.1 transcription termination factor NusA [Gracilimonas sediminicola]
MQNELSKQIISSFAEIAHEKGIERDMLLSILEDVFRTMIRKKYESDDSFEVILNADRGEIQILHVQEVVPADELTDEVAEITLENAQKVDPDIELYDELAQEIQITDFGRRAVTMARQQLAQRIREIEKDNIYEDYTDRVGEIILGDVYQVRHNKDILVNHNGVELLLPKSEQIYKDRYRKGDTIRAVVTGVHMRNGNPTVIISRTSELFLERLFENEIPEVFDGIIELVRIARAPGDRSKVAVLSHDERVDPVGACVGMKGIRIHAIVRELQNENIDVINFTPDKIDFIKRALQPAEVLKVELNEEAKHANVLVPADEVSKAIGKGGVNIRLASKLAEVEIDVYREVEAEDDIDIDEFEVDFGAEVIQMLHDIGCDTARAVLELDADELVSRTNEEIDPELAEKIMSVIAYEFEDEA